MGLFARPHLAQIAAKLTNVPIKIVQTSTDQNESELMISPPLVVARDRHTTRLTVVLEELHAAVDHRRVHAARVPASRALASRIEGAAISTQGGFGAAEEQ